MTKGGGGGGAELVNILEGSELNFFLPGGGGRV